MALHINSYSLVTKYILMVFKIPLSLCTNEFIHIFNKFFTFLNSLDMFIEIYSHVFNILNSVIY